MKFAVVLFALAFAFGCSTSVEQPKAPTPDPLESRSAELLYRTGIERAKRQDYIRAEQYLAAAITRGYPEARVVPELLRVCIASARLRSALRYAGPYLERNPGEWALRYVVAAVHLGLEQPAEARRELGRVLARRPDHGPARYLLAVTLRDYLGDREGARAAFLAYLEARPRGRYAAEARAWLSEEAEPGGQEAAQSAQPAPEDGRQSR